MCKRNSPQKNEVSKGYEIPERKKKKKKEEEEYGIRKFYSIRP